MRLVIYMGFNNPRTYKRGVENVIDMQAKALSSSSKKVYLFFDDRRSIFRWNGIICIGIPKGPARFLRLNAIVFKILKSATVKNYKTIVHSHNYLMSLLLFCGTDLFTVHDGLWYLKKCFHSRLPWLFWAIERIVYRRAARVHCNSQFTYGNSQLTSVRKDASVIYCTTPMEHYSASDVTYLPAPDRITVFSVRSIEERARIDLIIEMAALSQEQSLNIDFVIAGKGPLLTHYRRIIHARTLLNIQLIGFVPDCELVARYRDCNCVLVTCENGEGFGLPIIEGYLFGKPVVASGKCAVPEVIVHPKYLSANNPEEMLAILQMALAESGNATYFREHYDKYFSNAIISEQFSKLYDTVFAKGRGPFLLRSETISSFKAKRKQRI